MEYTLRLPLVILLLAALASLAHARAARAQVPRTTGVSAGLMDLHQKILDDYLASRWDELAREINPKTNKDILHLTAAQTADLEYIRQAVAECRPPWWDQCKAGKKILIHPIIWNRNFNIVYNQDAPVGTSLNYNNGQVTGLTANWVADDMDSTEKLVFNFTKGDKASLDAWNDLESAAMVLQIPVARMPGIDPEKKQMLQRFCDFRGYTTAAYYGTPTARRYVIAVTLDAYSDQNIKNRTLAARKPLGAMVIAELLSHPKTYTSCKMPTEVPDDKAEQTVATALLKWTTSSAWTFPEDKALRQAFKALIDANGPVVFETGKVKLPNGLPIYLDLAYDREVLPQRDAWIKQHLQGPPQK